MRRRALKGPVIIAQGNALGNKRQHRLSPERAHYCEVTRPFRALWAACAFPRALPWAIVIRAVGADDILKSTVLPTKGGGLTFGSESNITDLLPEEFQGHENIGSVSVTAQRALCDCLYWSRRKNDLYVPSCRGIEEAGDEGACDHDDQYLLSRNLAV